METLEDPFERNEEFVIYRDMGDKFLVAREKINLSNLSTAEKKIWDSAQTILGNAGASQNKVVTLLDESMSEQTREILLDVIAPNQDKFISKIDQLFNLKGEIVESALKKVAEDSQKSVFLIFMLGSIAALVAVFMIFVVRRMGNTENALVEQGERIRSLYQISAMHGVTLNEQISEMLKLGCRFLDMLSGKVSEIDVENNGNIVLSYYSEEDVDIEGGFILPLNKTYCQFVFLHDKPLSISNFSKSEYRDHTCYEYAKLESYIAVPIKVHGENFGTVSFSSITPRQQNFTDTDEDLVKLIGNWIGVSLERKFYQEELRVAKEEAENANLTKSSFLAKMSHELRTPLNAIIGYSEMLKEDAHANGQLKCEQDLERIKSSGAHLLVLINDILDISKIEAGQMELYLENVNIHSLIDEIAQTIKPLMQVNDNKFVVSVGSGFGDINCDRLKLKQVLLNLLSNATKFTEKGTISLIVRQAKQEGNNDISFSVEDSGIGIEDDQLDKIFGNFIQNDPSTSSKYGGTGLGLAISREICTLMGGNISVASECGKGSTFTVILPVSPEHSAYNQIEFDQKKRAVG